jgi:DNA-binding transcriptional regulator YiaG
MTHYGLPWKGKIKMAGTWSIKEEQYLRDNFKDKSVLELSVELNRSEGSVRQKLSLMKLIKNPGVPQEKIQYLRDNINLKTQAELATKLEVSEGTIRIWIKQFDIPYDKTIKIKRKSPRKWSEQDLKYLIENKDILSTTQLSKFFDCSSMTITDKLSQLGFRQRQRKEWTKEEDKILYDNFGKMTVKQIADKYFPDREPKHVIRRTQFLGLKIEQKRLTDEQKQYILDNHTFKTQLELAEELSIHPVSVGKILTLNGKYTQLHRPWEEKEVEFLKENYGKISYEEIAKKLDRNIASVSNEACQLRIQSPRAQDWSVEEKQYIKDNVKEKSYKEMSEHLGRTPSAVKFRCSSLNLVDPKMSKGHQEVLSFIQSVYSGPIIINDRKAINPFELDIYLPEENLAIEYNGLVWHSEKFGKTKEYHISKYNLCNEQNIKLFLLWEDTWATKQDIVKSMIKNKLKIIKNKVFARNCFVKELSSSEARSFVDQNHLSGYCNSTLKIGLFSKVDQSLVSVLTLRNPFHKAVYPHTIEIARFVSKIDTVVIGGFSKLLKEAEKIIKTNHPNVNQILTYADLSTGNGSVYENNGFSLLHQTNPDYFYTNGEERFNRFDMRAKDGKTEKQIADENEVFKVFGIGNKVFLKKVSK